MHISSRFRRSHHIQIQLAVLVAIIAVCIGIFIVVSSVVQSLSRRTGVTIGLITSLITGTPDILAATDRRTNIAVLGIAGGVHDGPNLTDSIMVMSISPSGKSYSVFSLPRDIWSDTLKDKINSAYYYGQLDKPPRGISLAKVIIGEVTGLPIHYGIVFDFSGFIRLIDAYGGIDLIIPESFTDTQYPIAGKENDSCGGDSTYACRYETLTYVKGPYHFTGSDLLKYVRSRHADGDQGTDFSRMKRQQVVFDAILTKMKNPATYFSLERVKNILGFFEIMPKTDMDFARVLTFIKMMSHYRKNTRSLDVEDYFIVPENDMYGGRYVLVPKNDFTALHQAINTYIDNR